MSREISVYMAQQVAPEVSKEEMWWYYVGDGVKGCFSNVTVTTIEDLAREMIIGIGLTEPFSDDDKIIYEPPVSGETFYVGGYWNRRLVPAAGYFYKPLEEEKRHQLEESLKRLMKTANR